MGKRDYYEVLGVGRDASLEQIKKAYRQLALQYHPDRNPGNKESEESFKEATEAYQVLSDAEGRQKYDRFGHAAFDGRGFSGFGDFSGFAEDIFGDLFSAFFGGNAPGASIRRSGRDLRYDLEITLEEAAAGCDKVIEFKRPTVCKDCAGSGSRPGTSPEKCRQCGGAGQVRFQQGFFSVSRTCPACSGAGSRITDPCPSCKGAGKVEDGVKLTVHVPAGIDTGQKLKLRGEGEQIKEGASGDLYVAIGVRPHPVFRRQGADIVSAIPIRYTQAVFGADIDVPTLNGPYKLKIPPGTQSGKEFRLKGKGVLDLQSGRPGDHHVRTFVFVPENLAEREKELLTELAALEGSIPQEEDRSLFDKIKEFFE